MAYNDIGLTSSLFAKLVSGNTPVSMRMKVLVPDAPSEPPASTTTIDKYDPSALGAYANNTDGGHYQKTIHDSKNNRTFILHAGIVPTYVSSFLQTDTTQAVVSIVNHFLDTSDPDYIETVNKTTSTGWPATDNRYIFDMAYDDELQALAIAVSGSSAPTSQTPELFVIDVNKYIDQLVTNECNELDDNPDYLTCYEWDAGDAVFPTGLNERIKFVRFYNHRFYVFAELTNGGDNWYQFGYFSRSSISSGTYTPLMVDGVSPQINAGGYDDLGYFPVTWPRGQEVTAGAVPGGGTVAGYWGDPVAPFTDVRGFNIDEDTGQAVFSCTPSRDRQNGFGYEASIFRLDLDSTDDPQIGSGGVGLTAQFNAGTGLYETNAGWYDASFSVPGGLAGYFRVYCTIDAPTATSINVYVETSAGTWRQTSVRRENPGDAGEAAVHMCGYGYGDTTVTVKVYFQQYTDPAPFTVSLNSIGYTYPATLQDSVGYWSTGGRIIQAGDTTVPDTETGTVTVLGDSQNFELAELQQPAGDTYWTSILNAFYLEDFRRYVFGVNDQDNIGLGLWVLDQSDGNNSLTKFTSADDLVYDNICSLHQLNAGNVALVCDDGRDIFYSGGLATNIAMQFFSVSDQTFYTDYDFNPTLTYGGQGKGHSLVYDPLNNYVGVLFGRRDGNGAGEMQVYRPDVVEYEWSRDPRKWWDGTSYDIIIGESTTYIDELNQPACFNGVSYNQSKGATSYTLKFNVAGKEYLPWVDSVFNDSTIFPGGYTGTLQDGTRLIFQRGIWDDYEFQWVDEGCFFIDELPVAASAGVQDLTIGAKGPLSMFTTRAVYKGYHEPDISTYTNVTLTTADNLTFYYDPGSGQVQDWATLPAPTIFIDGTETGSYTFDAGNGEIIFATAQTGTITATFSAYDSGTNEAEDIIWCILTYPNLLGGAGLDESYITRIETAETLSTTDNLTFSMDYNNLVSDYAGNQIYVNGVPTGSGFTWDYKNGTITFALSQAGNTITADYKWYTLQNSGVTLKPIFFDTRDYQTAYDCINEVLKRVAPNYVIYEARDGKIHCDYVTQKTTADVEIDDSDIVVSTISDAPMYDGICTRVLSYGEADITELPNKCLGKTVTDLLTGSGLPIPSQWIPASIAQITDGNPSTGVAAGYGRAWQGTGATAIDFLASNYPDGVNMLSIDMGEELEIQTVLVARMSQAANPERMQEMNIQASRDGTDWFQIVPNFKIGPGQNISFESGADESWKIGSKIRYIRLRLVDIDVYRNSKGKADTQFSVSEVQAFTNKIIEGVATLQNEDPTADLYDEWGLLDKYSILTRCARGGKPDSALRDQAACNLDAKLTLQEFARLMNQVSISSPWLPGVPLYSTIKITNSETLEIIREFFVENRTFSDTDDNFSGATLP